MDDFERLEGFDISGIESQEAEFKIKMDKLAEIAGTLEKEDELTQDVALEASAILLDDAVLSKFYSPATKVQKKQFALESVAEAVVAAVFLGVVILLPLIEKAIKWIANHFGYRVGRPKNLIVNPIYSNGWDKMISDKERNEGIIQRIEGYMPFYNDFSKNGDYSRARVLGTRYLLKEETTRLVAHFSEQAFSSYQSDLNKFEKDSNVTAEQIEEYLEAKRRHVVESLNTLHENTKKLADARGEFAKETNRTLPSRINPIVERFLNFDDEEINISSEVEQLGAETTKYLESLQKELKAFGEQVNRSDETPTKNLAWFNAAYKRHLSLTIQRYVVEITHALSEADQGVKTYFHARDTLYTACNTAASYVK